jgi:hypothetical protein
MRFVLRKSGIKNRLSPAAGKDNADKMQRDVKFFDKLTKKNRNVVGLVTKEEVEGLDEGYMPSTQKRADKMMKQVSKLRRAASKKGDFGHPEAEAKHKQADKIYNFSRLTSDLAKKRDKDAKKSEFNEDIYDIILSHLIAEGYADTNESALVIMANMSEEWRQSIVEGDNYDKNRKRAAQRAAERNAARDAGKTGNVPGVGYVTPRRERETYVDAAGTTRHKSGAKMP